MYFEDFLTFVMEKIDILMIKVCMFFSLTVDSQFPLDPYTYCTTVYYYHMCRNDIDM